MNFSDKFIKDYNDQIERLKKADSFIEKFGGGVEFVHYGKKAYTLPVVLEMYNKVIEALSRLQLQYKKEYGVEMSIEEKLNGFEI